MLEVFYLGVNEESLYQKMSVYPNPASNFMYIDFHTDIDSFEYRLFSMEGALIDQGHIESDHMRINTQSIQPGTYLVHIKSEVVSISQKVLIR